MSESKHLIIPINAAEAAALRAEAKSYLLFSIVFGTPLAIAAVVVMLSFRTVEAYHWVLFGVLMAAVSGFFGYYLCQAKKVWRNLADGRSVMYSGSITRKHVEATDGGEAHHVFIGDRRFTIDESLFEQLRLGDEIAVREWLNSGEYLDHTTDRRRIAELKARALNTDRPERPNYSTAPRSY